MSQCDDGEEVAADDTCLYVTLLDQFGDGWASGVEFTYWLELPQQDTNHVSSTLSCGCPQRVGCIHPSDLHESQVLHLEMQMPEGSVTAPFYWEVYWTAQIVENGVMKDTYYGGHNTSMSFAYTQSTQSFQSQDLRQVWQPGLDMNCSSALSFMDARLYDSNGPGRAFSAASETTASIAGAGYLEGIWVITDKEVSCVHNSNAPHYMPRC